jgi:hypothetical protein
MEPKKGRCNGYISLRRHNNDIILRDGIHGAIYPNLMIVARNDDAGTVGTATSVERDTNPLCETVYNKVLTFVKCQIQDSSAEMDKNVRLASFL